MGGNQTEVDIPPYHDRGKRHAVVAIAITVAVIVVLGGLLFLWWWRRCHQSPAEAPAEAPTEAPAEAPAEAPVEVLEEVELADLGSNPRVSSPEFD